MKKLIKISLNKFILCVCSFVTDIDTSLTFIEHIQFAVSCTYFNLHVETISSLVRMPCYVFQHFGNALRIFLATYKYIRKAQRIY